MRYILLPVLIFLTACTSPEKLKGSGELAYPPYGYIKLCAEQPTHPACVPSHSPSEKVKS